ncbi:glycosyl hydrolase family 28-related protein [Pseudoroseomonas cervicalis]|uniref:Poly(Beta-D-mannuronate) C5 epimerase 2 domain protein n=1 Tax=Pseudoroseomonas cervicalis ATCC 49957 TaxID=525371 RepID=D5RIL1_9PROT|nr:glycosyl hydrolase family 28-related protein [Pseudoroseomonas cervicalis]EFH12865.1 poly(beta-D-mannuronate) C5 epimerase 2 domain protein [Pseudoroseomonas cervicalis ATCC 49957]
MSDKKISELPAATTLSDTDLTPVVQGVSSFAETRGASLTQLRAGVLAERSLHVRDFGAVGDGVTDDTAALQAAIDAAFAQGGGTVRLGPRRYLIASAELLLREHVQLVGQPHLGGWRTNGNFATVRYALLVDAARTVRLQRNAGLHGVALLRRGLTAPNSLRQGLDAANAFAGTAITIGNGSGGNSAGNGADTTLSRLLILGFNWGIYSDANARVRISDILGDCTNGLYLGRSFDVSRVSEVNWHPLVTTSRSWSNTRLLIAAVADNGAGQFRITTATAHGLSTGDLVNVAEVRTSGAPALYGRWTVTVVDSTRLDLQGSSFAAGWSSGGAVYVNPNRRLGSAFVVNDCDMASFDNCFEYGHEIGFDVQDEAHSCNFTNIGTDGWVDMADPLTIGLRIGGTALRTKVFGGFLSSKGCSVQISTTGGEQHELIGVNVTGGARRIAEVLSGQVSFVGCDFTGAAGTGNATISAIHLGSGAGSVLVTGCDTGAVTFTADSAAAMQRLQLAANRPGAATATTQRLAAGRIELATVSAAAALETRLSSDTDGAVTLHRRSTTEGAQLRFHGTGTAPVASLTASNTELVFQGEGSNGNAALVLGGSGMTQPQTLRLRRLSASPAANDRLLALEAGGNSSTGTERVYARIAALAESVTNNAESGAIILETRSSGTLAERFRLAANGTVTLTGPLVLPADPTAALQAATRQYVDNQFTERRFTSVLLSAATALTQASHNARMLVANPGTTGLSLNWASTGDGFSCSVINRSGADLPLTLVGFTAATPANSDGFTRIRAGGVATLLVYSPDGGTTRICHLTGAGAP